MESGTVLRHRVFSFPESGIILCQVVFSFPGVWGNVTSYGFSVSLSLGYCYVMGYFRFQEFWAMLHHRVILFLES